MQCSNLNIGASCVMIFSPLCIAFGQNRPMICLNTCETKADEVQNILSLSYSDFVYIENTEATTASFHIWRLFFQLP